MTVQQIETITSHANPLLKDVRRAITKGTLTASGLAVAEGVHLLEEAIRSEVRIPAVLLSASAGRAMAGLLEKLTLSRIITLPDAQFVALSATETPQGVMALVEPPEWTPEDLFTGRPLVVVLDGVQDPGNAGAIARAAEAFGATGIVFARGTVGLHHPRTLRASAGSLFRLPCVSGLETEEVVALLAAHRCASWVAMPWSENVSMASAVKLTGPVALVIGNEGHGVGLVLQEASTPISIATQKVESLNASVAAAILLYEASRQRGVFRA